MGYNLTIGKIEQNSKLYNEFLIDFLNDGKSRVESESLAARYSMCVKDEYLDYAPAFGEESDYTNQREPSYRAWSMVCEVADLNDLFFGNNGALKKHPGIFQITKIWLDTLNEKIELFKQKYPMCVASYEETSLGYTIKVCSKSSLDGDVSVNEILCRIEWLDFWCNYAFENYREDAYIQNI